MTGARETYNLSELRGSSGSLPLARRIGNAFSSDKIGLAGLLVVILVGVVAILAPWLAPQDPNQQDLLNTLEPPSWLGGPQGSILGTDFLGRDILSRVVYGSRVSLIVGLASVCIAGTIGTALGVTSGYRGGWVDSVIMRFADFQLAVPFLILAIAILGILGSSLRNVIIVLGITGWVTYARVVRSEVLSLREREFVIAAIVSGASVNRVMLRHILPNIAAPAIIIASLEVARMIISEAALSFLGLGVPPAMASWGGMVSDGRDYLRAAWWIATFPGLAIVVTVLGINLFGDWLRDTLDPRMRGNQG